MTGSFITFEGGEGSGKTTLIARLRQELEKHHSVVTTREPGGTPIADEIRRLLLAPESKGMASETELLLYMASRAEHCQKVIRPALEAGKIVLCDRFADATLAYQGYARGLSKPWVETLNHFATAGLVPDMTVLLDIPVDVGLARANQRLQERPENVSESRFEEEARQFHETVRQAYLEIAKQNPARFVVLDAQQSPERLLQEVLAILERKRIISGKPLSS